MYLLPDIHLGKSTTAIDRIHNLDLFRTLCSQHVCSSVLALQIEDFLYGAVQLKPNIVAMLSEFFWRCEIQKLEEEEMINSPPADKQYLSQTRDDSGNEDDEQDIMTLEKELEQGKDFITNNVIHNTRQLLDKENVPSQRLLGDNLKSKPPTPRKITPRLDIAPPKSSDPEKKVIEKLENSILPTLEDILPKKEEIKNKGMFRNNSAPDILGGLPQSPLLARRAKQKQPKLLALEDWDMHDNMEGKMWDVVSGCFSVMDFLLFPSNECDLHRIYYP